MKFLMALVNGILAVGTSVFSAMLMRGHNYSDVGVPMYPYSKLAMPAAILVYLLTAFVGFYGLRKILLFESSPFFVILYAALLPLDTLLVWITVNF